MDDPVRPQLKEVLALLIKDAGQATKDQGMAMGLWARRMGRGERDWATHHAVLASSIDNSVKMANAIYEASIRMKK